MDKIAEVKPRNLFIAADGPRSNNAEDIQKCQESRESVLERIVWECKVKTLFRERNLGCRRAVSEAIDWFFTKVDRGIILEDDTLPDKSFFTFISGLLEYYSNDTRIFQVGGCNYNIDLGAYSYSYFFSKYVNIWGWGTWKRAWNFYSILNFSKALGCLQEELLLEQEINSRRGIFNKTYQNEIDTWDYLWSLTMLSQHGLTIIPRNNLVRNIGFSPMASRTKNINCQEANLEVCTFDEPFHHPRELFQIPDYNKRIREKVMAKTNLVERVLKTMRLR